MTAVAELAKPLELEVAGKLNVQDIVNQEGNLPNFSFPPELEVILNPNNPQCLLPTTNDYGALTAGVTHLDLFRQSIANLACGPDINTNRPSWTEPLLWFFNPKTHRNWLREPLPPQVVAPEIGQVMGTSREGISFYLVPTSEPFYGDDLGLGVQDFNVRQAIKDPQKVDVGQKEQVPSPLIPYQIDRPLTNQELDALRKLAGAFIDTVSVVSFPIRIKVTHGYDNRVTTIDSFSLKRLLEQISRHLNPDQLFGSDSRESKAGMLPPTYIGRINKIEFGNRRGLWGPAITAHEFMKGAEWVLRDKVSANLLKVQKAAMRYITALVSQSETFCRLPRGRRDELISILKYYIFTWPYVLADLYQRICWQPLNEYASRASRVEGIDLTR